jgi:hypothetical protein
LPRDSPNVGELLVAKNMGDSNRSASGIPFKAEALGEKGLVQVTNKIAPLRGVDG